MIKLKKDNKRKEEEEVKKKQEEDSGVVTEKKTKKPPGELRLTKELAELDLPGHAQVKFAEDQIMSF